MSGRYESAIERAERAIHRMPRWHFAHFILVTSLAALGKNEQARRAVMGCRDLLPDLTPSAIERVPLQDAAEMQALRTRSISAGFA